MFSKKKLAQSFLLFISHLAAVQAQLQSLSKRITEIWSGNLPILSVTCYPIVPLSPKMNWKQLNVVLLGSFQGIIGPGY